MYVGRDHRRVEVEGRGTATKIMTRERALVLKIDRSIEKDPNSIWYSQEKKSAENYSYTSLYCIELYREM